MRLAEPATVSNFELLKPPNVGVTVDSVICLFLPFFSFHIDVHMACFGPFLNNPSNNKMRLVEPTAVFNFERLNPPYVGVTAGLVGSPFFTLDEDSSDESPRNGYRHYGYIHY